MNNVQPDNNTTTDRMDTTSPSYLHPSENVGSTLLPVVFYGNGYRSWRRVVLRTLLVKRKTSFINEKIVKPDSTDPSFEHWERCDDMVTSWILNSLSPNLRDGLQHVSNAKELWEELEDRYDQTNRCELKGLASTKIAYTSEEGNSQGGEENLEVRRQMPPNLSKGLYEQLLNLLGTLQAGNKDNDDSCISNSDNTATSGTTGGPEVLATNTIRSSNSDNAAKSGTAEEPEAKINALF
ncbi:uncharacterized protein LOC125861386 [Solanum stenotomum]|uniref:uncharacterized protein LOC125861386 n=1 Tax=Solanum stenotomum TaxID=172797 RepID=UPI0020D06BEB|nr:uncharacterized protein LOC125861386 [Solanum stenotomum]